MPFLKLTKKERAMLDKHMEKARTGLYQKFIVHRTDGRDGPGQKHEHCQYFVLDITHDPFARSALLSYAEVCKNSYPVLAQDLKKLFSI